MNHEVRLARDIELVARAEALLSDEHLAARPAWRALMQKTDNGAVALEHLLAVMDIEEVDGDEQIAVEPMDILAHAIDAHSLRLVLTADQRAVRRITPFNPSLKPSSTVMRNAPLRHQNDEEEEEEEEEEADTGLKKRMTLVPTTGSGSGNDDSTIYEIHKWVLGGELCNGEYVMPLQRIFLGHVHSIAAGHVLLASSELQHSDQHNAFAWAQDDLGAQNRRRVLVKGAIVAFSVCKKPCPPPPQVAQINATWNTPVRVWRLTYTRDDFAKRCLAPVDTTSLHKPVQVDLPNPQGMDEMTASKMRRVASECLDLVTNGSPHPSFKLLPDGAIEYKLVASISPTPDLYDDESFVRTAIRTFAPTIEIVATPSLSIRGRTPDQTPAPAPEVPSTPVVQTDRWYSGKIVSIMKDKQTHLPTNKGFINIEELKGDVWFFSHAVVDNKTLRVGDVVDVQLKSTTFKDRLLPDAIHVRLREMARDLTPTATAVPTSTTKGFRYKSSAYEDSTALKKLAQHSVACPHCNQTFFSKSMLEQHILTKHSSTPPQNDNHNEELEKALRQRAGKQLAAKMAEDVPSTIEGFSAKFVPLEHVDALITALTNEGVKTMEDLQSLSEADSNAIVDALKLPLGPKKRLQRAFDVLRDLEL